MKFDPATLPYVDPAVDRRVALVTAGNSGVGWFTVLHLYLHGYIVYIAGRLRLRSLALMRELEAEAAGRLEAPGELHFLEIDLALLSLVLAAVAAFKASERSLDLLINNACAAALPYALTKDGFEVQLQTNYVAPFVLTTKLLPLLEKTLELRPHDPPRVLYLSSVSHHFAVWYFKLNGSLNHQPGFVFTWLRYARAKTAGIHMMRMLALRNPRVLFMSVHPGLVMAPNTFVHLTRLPIIGIVFWCWFQIIGWLFGVTPEAGLRALLRCGLDPDLTVERDSGQHFATNGKPARPLRVASNMDYAARSWIWTVHQLGKRHISVP